MTEPTPPSPSAADLEHVILRHERIDFRDQRVCLFASFDLQAQVDPHVLHALAALKREGFIIVFLSSSAAIDEVDLAALSLTCAIVIRRANVGYDFAGWALALHLYPEIWNARELVVTNDSVYGPVGSLATMFERMAQVPCDFWGVAESLEVHRHVQSYFLVFRRSGLEAPVLRKFWADVVILDEKWHVIVHYEVLLAATLTFGGLTPGVLAPNNALPQPVGNPSLDRWRELLALGSPFVKVVLLRDGATLGDLTDWPSVVAARGYDPALIFNHLRRLWPNAPALTAG